MSKVYTEDEVVRRLKVLAKGIPKNASRNSIIEWCARIADVSGASLVARRIRSLKVKDVELV